MYNLADFGDMSCCASRTCCCLRLEAPSMVKVLPAPVWPYIKTVPLMPSRELSTIALRELFS